MVYIIVSDLKFNFKFVQFFKWSYYLHFISAIEVYTKPLCLLGRALNFKGNRQIAIELILPFFL